MRIAFTTREGGISQAPYEGLNLGAHVGDDPDHVMRNRELLEEAALEYSGYDAGELDIPIISLNQVHGTDCIVVQDAGDESLNIAARAAKEGADAIVVSVPDVSALLCFADCLPLIIASPCGAFAVAHAGWRGALAGIAQVAANALAEASGEDPSEFNAYIGPCIGSCCFEVSEEIAQRFQGEYGDGTCVEPRHVDLRHAVSESLARAGVSRKRTAVMRKCTSCDAGEFYSYRAEGGTCGRHGAFALNLGKRGE